MMTMNMYILKYYRVKMVAGANARTSTPMNLVVVMPTSTCAPIAFSAFLALYSLVPLYLMKFIPM